MERPSGFFHGSELPRLLVLAVVMVVGWGLVWQFATADAAARRARADGHRRNPSRSSPIAPSSSRRSPTGRRSSSAITRRIRCLLSRARGRSPAELAAVEPPRYRPAPISGRTPSSIAACRSICSGPPCACSAIRPS